MCATVLIMSSILPTHSLKGLVRRNKQGTKGSQKQQQLQPLNTMQELDPSDLKLCEILRDH